MSILFQRHDERGLNVVRCFTVRHVLVVCSLAIIGFGVTACSLFNTHPIADLSFAGLPYGPAPFVLTFDISGSEDPDGEIVSFALDFGDGSPPIQGTDLAPPIEYTYTTPGNYFASLTVTDNEGASSSVMWAVSVYQPPSV